MILVKRSRRILLSVVTALVVLAVDATPAAAHTVSGQGSTNFRTTVTGVRPPTPGLTVRSVELGSRLEVTWTGPEDLTILGYAGEPYLRVGPDGVYRNRRSPATYLNVSRNQTAVDPAAAGAILPDVQLPPPVEAVGTVTARGTPAPIAGAVVEFFALDATGKHVLSLGSALTDDKGRYKAVLPDVAQPAAMAP